MCLQFHVKHVMRFGYMFVYWFGVDVDVIIEIGVWCDLCEKPSIGC